MNSEVASPCFPPTRHGWVASCPPPVPLGPRSLCSGHMMPKKQCPSRSRAMSWAAPEGLKKGRPTFHSCYRAGHLGGAQEDMWREAGGDG